MAWSPDSEPTTADTQDSFALKIIATQGACLAPRPSSPVFQPYDAEFAPRLSWKLCGCVLGQKVRRLKYREAADELAIGRTPPKIKEKYDAEIKALEEAPSADSSDNDGDGDGGDGRVGPKKEIPAPGPRRRSPRIPRLPTPPQSADDPPPKPRGRKRRRNP